ncbi:MAG TPA: hypothetical protein VII91_06930 [Bauldia sp.]
MVSFPLRRVRHSPPNPREIPFEPHLEHPPLRLPKRPERDLVYERRVEADRLCLWMACRRALCRSSRRCNGTLATCLFENPDIVDPILT